MAPLTPFLVVPAVEIAVFVLVAATIGFWPALLLALAISMIGALVLRALGVATLRRAQLQLEQGQFTADEIVSGLWLAAAGVLMLLPGFVSGLLGLTLFLPTARRALGRWLVGRYRAHAVGGGFSGAARGPIPTSPPIAHEHRAPSPPPVPEPGPVIDVEFEDIPPEPPTRHRPKH